MSKFIDGAILLAIVTAFLFCSSTAYTHGYFIYLHLDSDVLDRNFHQALYKGLILNFEELFALSILAVALFYFRVQYVSLLSDYVNKSFNHGRKLIKIRQTIRKLSGFRNNKETVIVKRYKLFQKRSVVAFVSIFVFLLSMAGHERNGQADAKKALDSIERGLFTIATFKSNKETTKVAYLYCGSRNCAGLDIKTNEIVYFPQQGHRIYIQKSRYKELNRNEK